MRSLKKIIQKKKVAVISFYVTLCIGFIIIVSVYSVYTPVFGQLKQNLSHAFPFIESVQIKENKIENKPFVTPSPAPTVTPIPTSLPTPLPTLAITSTPTPIPVVIDNTPPGSGYKRQTVSTEKGTFTIDIIAADLNSTRVLVDTASDSNCSNDCPVLSLSEYAARNGAFAAINGSYFCPSTYPQCAGKTNSFDTLLMNKNKTYFNSDNNVYSTVPVVVFKDNWARFMRQSLEWGRDTSVDSVIAMQPLLVFNNELAFGGSTDAKMTGKGPRCFIGATGSTVYIGVVRNATMEESALVLKALKMENALNLDEGGSTALWYNGSYQAGPGRNIPNAIVFVRK